MMIIGIIIMLVFLAILVVGAIYLIRSSGLLTSCPIANRDKADPLDIAKERYAKGDISKEEFEQLKKDLG